jgi:hypothetical protein
VHSLFCSRTGERRRLPRGRRATGALCDLPWPSTTPSGCSKAGGTRLLVHARIDAAIAGAFAAASGALALPDAVRAVQVRGHAMESAYPHGYGMGVVFGLDEQTVNRLAEQAARHAEPVYAANVNAPGRSRSPAPTRPSTASWLSRSRMEPSRPRASRSTFLPTAP